MKRLMIVILSTCVWSSAGICTKSDIFEEKAVQAGGFMSQCKKAYKNAQHSVGKKFSKWFKSETAKSIPALCSQSSSETFGETTTEAPKKISTRSVSLPILETNKDKEKTAVLSCHRSVSDSQLETDAERVTIETLKRFQEKLTQYENRVVALEKEKLEAVQKYEEENVRLQARIKELEQQNAQLKRAPEDQNKGTVAPPPPPPLAPTPPPPPPFLNEDSSSGAGITLKVRKSDEDGLRNISSEEQQSTAKNTPSADVASLIKEAFKNGKPQLRKVTEATEGSPKKGLSGIVDAINRGEFKLKKVERSLSSDHATQPKEEDSDEKAQSTSANLDRFAHLENKEARQSSISSELQAVFKKRNSAQN